MEQGKRKRMMETKKRENVKSERVKKVNMLNERG